MRLPCGVRMPGWGGGGEDMYQQTHSDQPVPQADRRCQRPRGINREQLVARQVCHGRLQELYRVGSEKAVLNGVGVFGVMNRFF